MVKIATFRWSKWRLFEVSWPLKKPRIPVQQRELKKSHFKQLQTALSIWGRPVTLSSSAAGSASSVDVDASATAEVGRIHTYINCDPIFNLFVEFESWFQQRFLLHKGKKNSSHFGSSKVARILDDPEKWPFSIHIQCLFWNVWFVKTTGVPAMRRDGKLLSIWGYKSYDLG